MLQASFGTRVIRSFPAAQSGDNLEGNSCKIFTSRRLSWRNFQLFDSQSTANSQQLTANSQQPTVNSQQSTVNIMRSATGKESR
ncbi:hypothetical protein [Tychonema sp. LEGE 07203]|uniref:hypothetical protein n=1 Tax=Tychonema sp. LEGE 07203 TaxID=1828671 RepID=UPI00187E665B|nr:hypothetical protein [Tychonema sp. LEGE 07203]MBE9095517.1 hypothetical protein [Tychonema sp. LEGE 07203]